MILAADSVDSSSCDVATRDVWFPWSFRHILGLPGSPLAIGAGAVLLSLVVDAAWFNASGLWQGYRVEGIPVWLHPYGSVSLMYAAFLGFGAVALIYLVRGADRDLSQLGPALGLEPGPLAEVRREVLSVPARSLRAGTALGLAVAAFDVWVMFTFVDLELYTFLSLVWVVVREVLYNVLVFRVLTWAIVVALRLSRLARERVRVHLVDLGSLRPFTQNGVRLALFWLLLWAVWVPLLFVSPVEGNALMAFSVLIGVGIALSAVAIAIPTLGARRCVREAKAAELADVRGAIERDRGAALDPNHPDRAAAADRLPGLLAYEARVAAVPAWLLDSHSLRRVALYLLIPVASWVGGAMIERLVDAALD
jgi:hypothetical protein